MKNDSLFNMPFKDAVNCALILNKEEQKKWTEHSVEELQNEKQANGRMKKDEKHRH